MTDLIEPLRKLQTIDGEMYRLRHEQRRKPKELEEARQRLAAEQASSKSIDDRLKAVQVRHKEKEMELSSKETTIKKLQSQLSQVKTNKEYTTMQHEIEQHKADVSLLEEEILTRLDQIDQAKRELVAQQASVTKRQQALNEEERRVNGELKTIQDRMIALDQERKGITPVVQREALFLYERILTSREGLALVPLSEDSCGGCHMVQPPQVVSQVQLNAKLVTCESCSRILYLAATV